MENSGGITASLQGRYASALYDLASENGVVSAVESDLEKLNEAILGNGDLAALIRNPQVSRDATAKVMDGVAGVTQDAVLPGVGVASVDHDPELFAQVVGDYLDRVRGA